MQHEQATKLSHVTTSAEVFLFRASSIHEWSVNDMQHGYARSMCVHFGRGNSEDLLQNKQGLAIEIYEEDND